METLDEKIGEVFSIRLRGRLDATTSAKVEKHLLEAVKRGERKVLLDLADLEYVSSIGLRVLLVVGKRLKSAEGLVAFCSLQPAVQQVFDISGFSGLFSVFTTRQDALGGLG